MANAFNVGINDIIPRKILRVRIYDGQYIVNYFDVNDIQLPSYELTTEQLATRCNAGVTTNPARANNVRQYLIAKLHATDTPEGTHYLNNLMMDITTLLKYIPEASDIDMTELYMGYIKGQPGPEVLDRFLTQFELK